VDRAGVLAPLTSSALASTAAHSGRVGGLHVYAASTRGPAHAREGGVREDAFAVAVHEQSSAQAGCVVVAVSDGLGSSRDAHAAASVIAGSAARTVAATPWDHSWAAVAAAAVGRADAAAEDADEIACTVAALASSGSPESVADKSDPLASGTLALARVREQDGQVAVDWLTLGDSGVFVFGWTRRDWRRLDPDSVPGSNETAALPRAGSAPAVGSELLAREDVLVLATDGAWQALSDMPGQFGTAMSEIWADSLSPATFATLLDFSGPGLTDDRTLVVVRGRGAGG
jgi:serine/threonine protein phosphatase PrpC